MKTGKKTVTKSNKFIEARQSLTLLEQRIVFYLLSLISENDEPFKAYEIQVKQFADIFGLHYDNVIAHLAESCERLRKRDIRIENEKGDWAQFGWLSSSQYVNGSGKVLVMFDPLILPHYLKAKSHYTKFDFVVLAQIKSGYAMRLYELLKMEQFKHVDFVFSKVFNVSDFRDLLGVEPKKYQLFADFRKWILEPSLDEISKNTDLDTENIEYLKNGKTIEKIKITMRVKPEAPKLVEPPKPPKPKAEQDELTTRLLAFGFSDNQVFELRKKYANKVLNRTLLYTLAMMEQSEIKNPSAYFHKVLKDDGAGAWMNEQTKKLNKAEKIATEKAKKEQEAIDKASKDKTSAEAKKERRERLFNDFYALPVEQQEALRGIFKESLSLLGNAEMNMYKNAIASNPTNPEQYKSIVPFFLNWYESYISTLPIPFEFNDLIEMRNNY